MRLNLGCGDKKMAGWHNVDKIAVCNPDEVVDLERLPWPWADNSVDEVLFSHVLEHLGQTPDIYLGIIKELYRVCRDGATITIVVPHPRHDHFLIDPTHVRPITPEGLNMFSQAANRRLIARGGANTPLGIYLDVDLVVQSAEFDLDDRWLDRLKRGEITEADVQHAQATYYNVISQSIIVMKAIKPAGKTA
ncbi:MAG: methyltransferase domain-containing protein [Alphaproteobacteria bacterium]|nr:methyltransferase domain-containing protein [Alphaproteobacteria bacterium]